MTRLLRPPEIFNTPPAIHVPTEYRVVIVTGLSDPTSCMLSPDQRDFLRAVPVEEESRIDCNFPFVMSHADFHKTPIVRASLANSRQFLSSSFQQYQEAARPHWTSLLTSTSRLIVITGSCGLQIVNSLMERHQRSKVFLIALGPIAWRHPSCDHILIQGEKDYLSRICFRKADTMGV